MSGRFYFVTLHVTIWLCLIGSLGLAQAAEPQNEFKVGNWEGAAFFEGGAFSYCLVLREANSRKNLMVVRAPAVGYALAVFDNRAPFQEGASYNTFTRIDNSYTLRAEGTGANPRLLRIVLPDEQVESVLAHIAKGKRLRVDVSGVRTLSSSLRGSRKALDRLEQCYAENVQLAHTGSAPDVDVEVSRRVRQLAEAAEMPVPTGSLSQLRKQAETMDATAVILLALALIDLPEHVQYDDEASSWISLAADAGDIRALYLLGRMIQLGLTSQAYDGHAEELISEAADGGLTQALVDRAKSKLKTDPKAALRDLELAASQGHPGAAKLLADWQPAGVPKPDTNSVAAPTSNPSSVAEIIVASSEIPESEQVQVSFSGLPEQGTNWLAIAAANHTAEQYFDLVMLEEGTLAGSHRFKPLPAGDYQVRLYLNWPDGGYAIENAVPVTVKGILQTTPEPAPPQEQMVAAYDPLGNMACFGKAEYPESWRSEAKCHPQGCFFGEQDLDACLAIAKSKDATLVMHGIAQGLWPNECWLQNVCKDMREQPDFAAYRNRSTSPEPETPTAELRIEPGTVAPNGTLSVEVVERGSIGPDAWLGLFPASANGGSDGENAQTVLVREAAPTDEGVAVSFPAPSREGRYEIRLSDPDGDLELTREGFDVKLDTSTASLKLSETEFEIGEQVQVAFVASPDYPPDSWIGIVPAGAPHGRASRNFLYSLASEPLSGAPEGQLVFDVPDLAGDYELRLNETGNDRELASVAFTVTPAANSQADEVGSPPKTPDEETPQEASLDLVITVQSLLSVMGYDVGVPDGQVTPRTEAAIASFQRDNGRPERAQVTTDLRDALLAAIADRKEARE